MSNYRFETLQLHEGQQPDPTTGARAVPIYQTAAYVFEDADQAAARFALSDAGNIYGRLTNPTVDVFEKRIAALEGGVGALALSSGAAAVTYAIKNITKSGDHVVAANNIYGGTYNLLAHTLVDDGITTTFVKDLDPASFEAAIQDNTKLIFIETLGNPRSEVTDIEAISEAKDEPTIEIIANPLITTASSRTITRADSIPV
jgi:O-acetylhomoserine (thiol)-lyase